MKKQTSAESAADAIAKRRWNEIELAMEKLRAEIGIANLLQAAIGVVSLAPERSQTYKLWELWTNKISPLARKVDKEAWIYNSPIAKGYIKDIERAVKNRET